MLAPKFLDNQCPENTNLKERGIVLKKNDFTSYVLHIKN